MRRVKFVRYNSRDGYLCSVDHCSLFIVHCSLDSEGLSIAVSFFKGYPMLFKWIPIEDDFEWAQWSFSFC